MALHGRGSNVPYPLIPSMRSVGDPRPRAHSGLPCRRCHSAVERHVVADHAHLLERLRAAATICALDGVGILPSSTAKVGLANESNLPLVMSPAPPPKLVALLTNDATALISLRVYSRRA